MPTKEGKRRSGKSCRLRWCNQLDPAVNKASFSQWEMAVIIRAQAVPPRSRQPARDGRGLQVACLAALPATARPGSKLPPGAGGCASG